MTISKTKSSFYRRLYVAYLIDSGIASVPEIMAATGMPYKRRRGSNCLPSRACVLQMPRCSRVAWRARWASSSAGWTLLPAVGGGDGICGLR